MDIVYVVIVDQSTIYGVYANNADALLAQDKLIQREGREESTVRISTERILQKA